MWIRKLIFARVSPFVLVTPSHLSKGLFRMFCLFFFLTSWFIIVDVANMYDFAAVEPHTTRIIRVYRVCKAFMLFGLCPVETPQYVVQG